MQLLLNTAELNIVADVLLTEQSSRASAAAGEAAGIQAQREMAQRSRADDELLNKILVRDLRLDSGELLRLGDLLATRKRELKDEIARAQDSPAAPGLRQKLGILERALEKINEACVMF
ncbi:MAG TPA: hypothetical protein VL240_05845 [Candidatus Binatia bacterium]|nr:hypothetical protein [Candidatus Binatia bacterium]